MKPSTVFLCALLATTSSAFADDPAVPGNASTTSDTSVSANRRGASASDASTASADTKPAQVGAAGSSEMNATLSKPVDAHKAKPGDPVTATSDSDAKAADGTSIKRGSKLVGHVTQARPLDQSASGSAAGESMLSIVFDKAVLRDGREVPLNATVQAISAAQSATSLDSDMSGVGMGAGGFGAGAARGGGGGLLGGAGGAMAGGVTAGGGLVGGVGRGVSSTAGGAAGARGHSAGAVGGLNGTGMLTTGSQGVFGIDGLELASSSAGNAQGSVIASSKRNVRLDGGTRMLLVDRAGGSAMASGAAQAAGSVSQSGAQKNSASSPAAPSQKSPKADDRK